jgi:glycerol uptake facilitator-like aquaporin
MLIDKFFAELLGTFVFLAVIITSVQSRSIYDKTQAWIKIGLALSISILAFGFISGGHFNPAVSFMFYVDNKLSLTELIIYIIAQILGATMAYLYFTYTKSYLKLQ